MKSSLNVALETNIQQKILINAVLRLVSETSDIIFLA